MCVFRGQEAAGSCKKKYVLFGAWQPKRSLCQRYVSGPQILVNYVVLCVRIFRLVHMYNASISTRRSMCEPGWHKLKHKKKELFPSSCACIIVIHVNPGQCKHKHQRNESIFLSADKQINLSSSTLTVMGEDGNGNWRNTAPGSVLIALMWTCLGLQYIYTCTYAYVGACIIHGNQPFVWSHFDQTARAMKAHCQLILCF